MTLAKYLEAQERFATEMLVAKEDGQILLEVHPMTHEELSLYRTVWEWDYRHWQRTQNRERKAARLKA